MYVLPTVHMHLLSAQNKVFNSCLEHGHRMARTILERQGCPGGRESVNLR